MDTQVGLRQRKKHQTRLRITEVALELFAEDGFDNVSVSRIARIAEVSEATVFNYFATKEDLIYGGMEAYEDQLLEAIRARPAGTTVTEAFRDYVLQPRGALASADPAVIQRIALMARVIAGSTALQTREQLLVDRATRALAEVIAEERGARIGDVEPWVIANALMGVNRAITQVLHRGAQQGRSGRQIARTVLTQARRAFDILENGLTR